MTRYLLRRIVQNVLIFFVFLVGVYVLVDAQPGDYADIYTSDPRLTPEMREQLRANLGLDQPVLVRFGKWLVQAVQGDLGISFSNFPMPVTDVIIERAPRTILLFLSANLIAYYLGFFMGKVLAWQRGSKVEYGTTLLGVSLYTVFLPWFALMMVWFFAYTLKIFPIGKFIDPLLWRKADVEANTIFLQILLSLLIISVLMAVLFVVTRRMNPSQRRPFFFGGVAIIFAAAILVWISTGNQIYALDILKHLVLPILTLGLVNFAGIMLLTRNSMLETMREDYIQTARAKGLPEKVVRDKHASRNAMLPVATSFILSLAFVLDGGVITETIFSWPGMGRTLLAAALSSDIPMVIGALVFTGFLALSGHLIADILYAFLDPRIRYS